MCRKIAWCYGFIFTLMDISLNTKLSAQGKSHGDDSMFDGVSHKEWGGHSNAPLYLSPPALDFGERPLATPHTLTVTLTNLANTTLYLASLAGTTPHFHASFFNTKSLPPEGNTSFSVVFLGRREGPVTAHLYLHTSQGTHRYPVSALGTASPWQLWPWSLRVPRGALLSPTLHLTNPTTQPAQVLEVYSSAEWVALELEGGSGALEAGRWLLPARGGAQLLVLRVAPPAAPHHTAYVSIKVSTCDGLVRLILTIEASVAPPGEYLAAPDLRLRTATTSQKPHKVQLLAGNSGPLQAAVRGRLAAWARCAAHPGDVLDSLLAQHNGGSSEGVSVKVLVDELPPNQSPIPVAELTIDYKKLWESRIPGSGAPGCVWCQGAVRLGRAQLPLTVGLHRGAVGLQPHEEHVVGSDPDWARQRPVTLHNKLMTPLHILALQKGPNFDDYLILSRPALGVAPPLTAWRLGLLRARLAPSSPRQLSLTAHTNHSSYTLQIYLYKGLLEVEWEPWYESGGALELGVVPAGGLQLRAGLHNPGPAALCVARLGAQLGPNAAPSFTLLCDMTRQDCMCIPSNSSRVAVLSVGECSGALAGGATLWLGAGGRQHWPARGSGRGGALRVRLGGQRPVLMPFAGGRVEVLLGSSLGPLRVLDLSSADPDPALSFQWTSSEVEDGAVIGSVTISPEKRCGAGGCYSGQWEGGGGGGGGDGLAGDLEEVRRRARVYQETNKEVQGRICVRTSLVVRSCVEWSWSLGWSRLCCPGAPRRPPLGALGAPLPLGLRLRNPSPWHPLRVSPQLHRPGDPPQVLPDVAVVSPEGCSPLTATFSPASWSARGGELPELQLPGGGEAELQLTFTPQATGQLYTYLYLRNNLTVLEAVVICGEGAAPKLELTPAPHNPVEIEVSECGVPGVAVLTLSNVGVVGATVRGASVAGGGCRGRGFRVSPCGALVVPAGASRAVTVRWSAGTLSRAAARLQLGALAVGLRGRAAPALLRACPPPPAPPTPPAPPLLVLLAALLLLPATLYAAARDAERLLRPAPRRAPPRPPLDLRRLPAPPPPPPPPPPRAAPRPPAPARRRRPRPRPDPAAEARAFDAWRDSLAQPPPPPPTAPPAAVDLSPDDDTTSTSSESLPAPEYSDPSEQRPDLPATEHAEDVDYTEDVDDADDMEQEDIFSSELDCSELPDSEAVTPTEPERVSTPAAQTPASSNRSSRRSVCPGPRRGLRAGRRPRGRLSPGALWSHVVGGASSAAPPAPAAAPPAPTAPAASHSLFYYSAAPPAAPPPPPHYAWPPAAPTDTYHAAHHYTEDKSNNIEEPSGAFGSIGSVWGNSNNSSTVWWRDPLPTPPSSGLGAPGTLGNSGGLATTGTLTNSGGLGTLGNSGGLGAPGTLGNSGGLGAPGSLSNSGGLGAPGSLGSTGGLGAPGGGAVGSLRPPPGFGSPPLREFDPFQSPLAEIWNRDWRRPEDPR